MPKVKSLLLILVLSAASSAFAQQTGDYTITNGNLKLDLGKMVLWANSWGITQNAVSNSLEFVQGTARMAVTSGGNVGIGTTIPTRRLAIRGTGTDTGFIEFRHSSNDVPYVGLGYDQTNDGLAFKLNLGASDFNGTAMFIKRGGSSHGNVGIGTSDPRVKLDVGGWPSMPTDVNNAVFNVAGDLFAGNISTVPIARLRYSSNAVQGFLSWNLYYNGAGLKRQDQTRPGYQMTMDYRPTASPPRDGFYFDRYADDSGAATPLVTITGDGRLGVGVLAPAAALDVFGNGHFSGSVTGSNIAAHFQDVAEWVPSERELPPATVVVVHQRTANTVTASMSSYDTAVAGVVSAQPGISLGHAGPHMLQVATTGRVKVRVDATKHAIALGDLLVTSDIPGTAMKSEPLSINGRSFHQPGTILGKALEPLEKGQGEILVLLSLQ